MPKLLDISSDNLIDFTLKMQKINDVALPIAVQNSLNKVVKEVKFRYLKEITGKMFDIKKRTFFKANSGFTAYKAKQFGYNISRIRADVGITKSRKPYDKATKQVGHQQTAKNIKRSINPLGKKPLRKTVIDVLSKKPEIYSYSDEGGFNPAKYYRKAGRAKQRNAPFIVASGGRGRVNQVKRMTKYKSGKRKGRVNLKLLAIGSYIKDGEVKLTKKNPFLNRAVDVSAKNVLEKEYIRQAELQFNRVLKR